MYEAYATLIANGDFDQPQKTRFLGIVHAADLSCPLEQEILSKTRDALTAGDGGERYTPLFEED